MYYYGARYYSAWTCRFISTDPLARKYSQLTSYNYAGNKPINHYDIDGMQSNGGDEDGSTPEPIYNSGKLPAWSTDDKRPSWLRRNWKEIVSGVADLSPVGWYKGVIEAISGKDLITGNELSITQRVLGAIPVSKMIKGALRVGKLVGEGIQYAGKLRKAKKASKLASKSDDAAATTTKQIEETATTTTKQVEETSTKVAKQGDETAQVAATQKAGQVGDQVQKADNALDSGNSYLPLRQRVENYMNSSNKGSTTWIFGFESNVWEMAQKHPDWMHLMKTADYKTAVEAVFDDPNTEIHFILTNIDEALSSMVRNPGRSATNWEISELYHRPEAWDRTIFHFNGKKYIGDEIYDAFQ